MVAAFSDTTPHCSIETAYIGLLKAALFCTTASFIKSSSFLALNRISAIPAIKQFSLMILLLKSFKSPLVPGYNIPGNTKKRYLRKNACTHAIIPHGPPSF